MINLLPPAARHDFTAGRVNALLVRYIWITLSLFGLLAILCGLTFIMLDGAEQTSKKQIDSDNSNVSSLGQIQQRADLFRANLATAKAILDQQTHYSETILKISSLMTTGTYLNNISLDQTTYGTPMTLQVFATSETAVINLKKNFQDSNLFTDVHFQSISIGAGSTSAGKSYPITAQLMVTINKAGA